MTRILLVRHGQASFGTDNYDCLSALGEEQSGFVGSHLHRLGHRPDALYSGALQRQRHTAQLAAAGMPDADRTDIPALDAFNEYDADAVFRAYLDGVIAAHPDEIQDRAAIYRDRRLFQRAFETVMQSWLRDPDPENRGLEPWQAFQDRVTRGLNELRQEHGRGRTIALFTSGGVIATGVGAALKLPSEEIIALNWRIYNASVSEIRYSRQGWTLMGFNTIDHLLLADPERLVTFR